MRSVHKLEFSIYLVDMLRHTVIQLEFKYTRIQNMNTEYKKIYIYLLQKKIFFLQNLCSFGLMISVAVIRAFRDVNSNYNSHAEYVEPTGDRYLWQDHATERQHVYF